MSAIALTFILANLFVAGRVRWSNSGGTAALDRCFDELNKWNVNEWSILSENLRSLGRRLTLTSRAQTVPIMINKH